MNSFFLEKASLICDRERDKRASEVWKSDPYFICPVNRRMEHKTKEQEKDVSTTTLHDQPPSLVYQFGAPCAEERPRRKYTIAQTRLIQRRGVALADKFLG